MTLILDDIVNIDKARQIIPGNTEMHAYVQTPEFCKEIVGLRDDKPVGVKTLNRVIEGILDDYLISKDQYVWGNGVPGLLNVFQDAFLNAAMWGNQSEPGKKIEVDFKYGILGSSIVIRDEGEGFDYRSRILDVQSEFPHDFKHNGGGMRKFHDTPLFVSYHDAGNIMSISTRVFSMGEYEKFNGLGEEGGYVGDYIVQGKIHARPAGQIVNYADGLEGYGFTFGVQKYDEKGELGKPVDPQSIIDMIAANFQPGEKIRVTVSGDHQLDELKKHADTFWGLFYDSRER